MVSINPPSEYGNNDGNKESMGENPTLVLLSFIQQ